MEKRTVTAKCQMCGEEFTYQATWNVKPRLHCDYCRGRVLQSENPYKGEKYKPAAKRHPCFGCGHFDPVIIACIYMIHQVDYHLPQRAHPRPPYYECLYRSSRFDKAGDFDQATKDKIKKAKQPVVDLETLKVYPNKKDIKGDTRWRYLTPQEIEIFKR